MPSYQTPEINVFVGDEKYTNDNNRPKSRSDGLLSPDPSRSSDHVEVPVHVAVPRQMQAALARADDRAVRFIDDICIKIGTDIYTITADQLLEARRQNNNIIYPDREDLTSSGGANTSGGTIEVDVSLLMSEILIDSNGTNADDFRVPLIIRVPKQLESHPTNLSVVYPMTDRPASVADFTDVRPASARPRSARPRSPYPQSHLLPDNSAEGRKERPASGLPPVLQDTRQGIYNDAKTIIGRKEIPDDIAGMTSYRPPKKGYQNSKGSERSGSVMTGTDTPRIEERNSPKPARRSQLPVRTNPPQKPVFKEYQYYRDLESRLDGGPGKNNQNEDDWIDSDSPLSPKLTHRRMPLKTSPTKARVLTFYRNGDNQFKGFKTAINPKDFPLWETLLVFLSEKISLPYGVRYIYTLSARPINDVFDFTDGESYVCASGQYIQGCVYGQSKEHFWKSKPNSGGRVRRTDISLFHQDQDKQSTPDKTSAMSNYTIASSSGADEHRNQVKARIISVVSNMNRQSFAKIILNPLTKQTFEEVLNDMSQVITTNNEPARKIYTFTTEQRVLSFSQLFREFRDHDTFILCGSEPLKKVTSGGGGGGGGGSSNGSSSRNPRSMRKLPQRETPAVQSLEKMQLTPYSNPSTTSHSTSSYTDGGAERRRLFGQNQNRESSTLSDRQTRHLVQQPSPPNSSTQPDTITVKVHGVPKTFYVPTGQPNQWEDPGRKPNRRLVLDWVYGYRGFDSRCNLVVIRGSKLLYYVGAIAVLYDKRANTQQHYLGHTEDITCVSVHPSEMYVATGQKYGSHPDSVAHVRIWDTDSLSTHAILGIDEFIGHVSSVAFASQIIGDWILAVDGGDNHTLTVWDWKSEHSIAKTKTHPETVVNGVFHPHDDRTIITCGKQHIYFWRLMNGRMLRDKKSGNFQDDVPSYVTCVTFAANGDVVSGDSSGNIIVWSKDSSNAYTVIHTIMEAHEKSVFALCMLEDGTLLSGGGVDRRIIAWDSLRKFSSAKAGRQLPANVGGVRTITPANAGGVDGLLLLGTTKDSILEGALQTKFSYIIQGHHEELWALAAHPTDDSFLTAGYDQQVCLWSSISHKIIWRVFVEKPCLSAAIHPSASVVALGTTVGRFIILNATNGMHIAAIQVGNHQLDTIRYSPDGSMLALGSHDKNVYVFSVSDGAQSYRKTAALEHNMFVTHVDWSSNNNYLQTVSGDYSLSFWNVNTQIQLEADTVKDTDWYTHSCILGYPVSGIWPSIDVNTDLNCCARSESKEIMAAGDSLGVIKLYRNPAAYRRAQCYEVKQCSTNVTCVVFTHDDAYLISTGGPDASLMQWRLYTSS